MRRRGLRWLQRHGHLDDEAVRTLDSADHAGGWSVDASVTIPGWDRQGLERLARYCTRPPLSQERLGRLNDQLLVYNLRRAGAERAAAPGRDRVGGTGRRDRPGRRCSCCSRRGSTNVSP